MQAFARLLDSLSFQPARNAKLRLIETYLLETPDPDRGWALAALTGGLDFPSAKPALLRGFGQEKIGEVLFALSYDYVGDLAETLALIWETDPAAGPPPTLADVVETLQRATRTQTPAILKRWLDALDSTGRWALLKLLTGALRVGVSARLAKQAVANIGSQPVDAVEEIWHGLEAPYRPLFDWLLQGAPRPSSNAGAAFLPAMLANPIDRSELDALDPAHFRAEWKWDGIRVQVAASGGLKRLYSRAGEDVSGAFPDIIEAIDFEGVFDGELLVRRDTAVAPFNDLQQRLNRKTVTPKILKEHPAHVRLYDVLWLEGEDLRGLSFDERRIRLEAWIALKERPRFDLSPLVTFADWAELAAKREEMRADGIEGLMLKRGDSAYLSGRPKGPWFKWKRDPMLADCVMMYAQRGHGKRSSFYSDFTFGCWRDSAAGGRELAPVGKAYFGFTDEELRWLDKWVRDHTTNRYGPVREVEQKLVLEIAFDGIARSTRHKSGVAMRFPRINRIRTDKPAGEADTVDNLLRLLTNSASESPLAGGMSHAHYPGVIVTEEP
ncbi:cisplatin damage response ATP-dependent DNA ligase [Reyranella sp.]|uniref:cisplatin damage response ATP-dependent DNA ligase n=1 Tax=Reyranella sp. TaxID=1929291 RepID=UPI000BC69622|nr:cisplatin damage response ATP-dependent DNA ligase [Reyranella sp.]OYY42667.1 MAG: ATP-dependent DNA ligase [Rhodospirillales bacterium 35-66-84]OYZ94387.1 MAG: ATP-dependent DNA ligase [Rhodospirillales bacterium 24-66-33]OZB25309.1 MAG: ATP-dependent DNA ligase [Rhodospirillales bacterium 39-66-50]HQS16502.1 cisplatin damage response ATP-dependent DNA ligase [Reyranella sp.]HQT13398.1 cisplatin damage response ATP-dependent DNA ligase [Reyranella sp.]